MATGLGKRKKDSMVSLNSSNSADEATTEKKSTIQRKRICWVYEQHFTNMNDLQRFLNENNYKMQKVHNTAAGKKEYYKCRRHMLCNQEIYLHHLPDNVTVSVFNNSIEHFHPANVPSHRGISDELKVIIKQLVRLGADTPMKIINTLKRQNIEPPTRKQLSNYLLFAKKEICAQNGVQNPFTPEPEPEPNPEPELDTDTDTQSSQPVMTYLGFDDDSPEAPSSPLVENNDYAYQNQTDNMDDYEPDNEDESQATLECSVEEINDPNEAVDAHSSRDAQQKSRIDWRFVKNFTNENESLEYLKQDSYWKLNKKVNTKSGQKVYYKCGYFKLCKAQIYIQYVELTNTLSVFRNSIEHYHPQGNEHYRGISPFIKDLIKEMFKVGISTPNKIIRALKDKNIQPPTVKQISNYLTIYRKELLLKHTSCNVKVENCHDLGVDY